MEGGTRTHVIRIVYNARGRQQDGTGESTGRGSQQEGTGKSTGGDPIYGQESSGNYACIYMSDKNAFICH